MSPGRCLESMSLWPQASLQALRTIVPPLPKHWLLVCLYSHCVISFSLPRLVYVPQAVSSISQHRRAEHIVIVPFSMLAFAIYALSFAMRRCVFGAQVALFLVWRRASPLHKRPVCQHVSIGVAYEFVFVLRIRWRFLAIPGDS